MGIKFPSTKTWYAFVGSEVFTPVVIKSYFFWDITSYRPLKVDQGFGGIFRFHVQGIRINEARNQHEDESKHSTTLYPRRYFCSEVNIKLSISCYLFNDALRDSHHRPRASNAG